jgi:hypothetical protein
MENTSKQVASDIAAWIKCVRVNITLKILHSKSALVLLFEWSALQWTLCGRYFTTDGQWYCRKLLREVRFLQRLKYPFSWKFLNFFSSYYFKTGGQKEIMEPKDIFFYLSSAKSPKHSLSECILLLTAAHKWTQWLLCSACYRKAYLLYRYCSNSTVCNWSLPTLITQQLLLHI